MLRRDLKINPLLTGFTIPAKTVSPADVGYQLPAGNAENSVHGGVPQLKDAPVSGGLE